MILNVPMTMSTQDGNIIGKNGFPLDKKIGYVIYDKNGNAYFNITTYGNYAKSNDSKSDV